MANSIRTPRQGTHATSRRIAQAVDDEKWQEFRLSLKGQSTAKKLDRLHEYWCANGPLQSVAKAEITDWDDDVVIRIDNYIKALCRGGQLDAGMGINDLIGSSRIYTHIKK